MTTSKALGLLFLGAISLTACKQKPEDLIVGRWKGAYFKNPSFDSLMAEQEKMLDTFGNATPPELIKERFGTANIDSIRMVQKQQIKMYKEQQVASFKESTFEFKSNGTAVIGAGMGNDSAAWSIEKEKTLVLDEKKLKGAATQGPGAVMRVDIEKISKDSLTLKFAENGASTIATFGKTK